MRDFLPDLVVMELISKEYQRALDEAEIVFAKSIQYQKGLIVKGLLRQYAAAITGGDGKRAVAISKMLDEVAVSKERAIFQYINGPREVDVYRDERGRFARYMDRDTSRTPPTHAERGKRRKGQRAVEQRMVSDIEQGLAQPGGTIESQAARLRAEQQAGAVRSISTFQDELMELFGDKSHDILVVVEGGGEGTGVPRTEQRIYPQDPVNQDVLDTAMKPNSQLTYALRPNATEESRQKFYLINELINAGMQPSMAAQIAQQGAGAGRAPGLAQAMSAYGGYAPSATKERVGRHLKTVDALGNYFTQSGDPQMIALGTAMRSAAKYGQSVPDEAYTAAERAGYRYRGTKDRLPEEASNALRDRQYASLVQSFNAKPGPGEKRPFRQYFEEDVRVPIRQRVQGAYRAGAPGRPGARPSGGSPYPDVTTALMAHAEETLDQRVSPRNYVDRVSRDVAATSLISQIPTDRRAVALSEKAGYGVPSSGIIIRSDGQMKEMYHGKGDDHYLPFSLKALPELRDGQYVRTRVLGGITPEDITTSVVGGARAGTVISGSGVFTIELKPDQSLVGRLGSPEVSQIGERYARILDQVAASGIYMQDISAEDKAKIANSVRTRMRLGPVLDRASQEAYNNEVTRLTNIERVKQSQLTDDETKKITEEVTAQVEASMPPSEQVKGALIQEEVKARLKAAQDEKVRAIRLNAEGYKTAMDALKLQYPSVIRRVTYEPLDQYYKDRMLQNVYSQADIDLRNRPSSQDTSYVQPNRASAHTKQWSFEKLPEAPSAAAAAAAVGAGAAAATTTGTPAATGEGGGAVAAAVPTGTNELLGKKRGEFKKFVENAQGELSRSVANRKANIDRISIPATTPAISDPTALVTSGEGMSAQLDGDQHPARLFKDQNKLMSLAATDKGRTVAMKLAYGDNGDTGAYWGNTFESYEVEATGPVDFNEEHGQAARALLDGLVSRVLLTTPGITKENKVGTPGAVENTFYINDDMQDFVKDMKTRNNEEPPDTPKPEELFAYRDGNAGVYGSQRSRVKDVLNEMLKNDAESRETIGYGRANANVNSISTLGLLALQSRAIKLIEDADSSASGIGADLVIANNEDAFKGSEAEREKAKKEAISLVQGAIGGQYLEHLISPGAAVPKVPGPRSKVEAAPPKSPDEELADELGLSEVPPQLDPDLVRLWAQEHQQELLPPLQQHPRLRPLR